MLGVDANQGDTVADVSRYLLSLSDEQQHLIRTALIRREQKHVQSGVGVPVGGYRTGETWNLR